jgi:fibronectin type 3 domain-containing protein
MTVPLISPPPIATALATSFTETAVTVTWLPPVVEIASARTPITYNVYAASSPTESSQGDAPKPLNEKPLDVPSFEHASAKPGVERCFVVRTVETVAGTTVESEPSVKACITPRDTFPPAAPKALSAVAGPGAINLIWDGNAEPDLVGYVVLRAEAPGDTLQPLNSEPTRETRYRDATVTPGVRYVYAIIAVDRAGNRSTASPRIEETAR